MRIKAITISQAGYALVCFLFLALAVPGVAAAHCDTLDGPVVLDAKRALEKGEVTPVLKWVGKNDEVEVQAAFKQTLAVRKKGGEAKELADRYFFETLVRLHRQGEGAPYTGLKPAGTDLGLAVQGADLALESGSGEELVKMLTAKVTAGVRERFAAALEKKKQAEKSVEAGRDFVKAYVEFVHYVERLHLDASGSGAHAGAEAGAGAKACDHH